VAQALLPVLLGFLPLFSAISVSDLSALCVKSFFSLQPVIKKYPRSIYINLPTISATHPRNRYFALDSPASLWQIENVFNTFAP